MTLTSRPLRLVANHRNTHAAALLLACLFAASAEKAAAGVRAIARQEPEAISHSILSDTASNDGTNANALLTADIGNAFASASASTGRLSGQSGVSLHTANEYSSGKFTALAEASSRDLLTVGAGVCDVVTCTSWEQIGVQSILLDFDVRAAGTVSGFAIDPRFNHALSSITYNWSLQAESGGGSKARQETGEATGSIETQSGRILVRPGEQIELAMSFALFSQASITSPRFSGFDSYSSSALSDFSHTLEWSGITGFTALDANGDRVDLSPNARFTLLNDEGVDFWNSAASFGAVPEPATWALMIGGFGMAGGALRRRRTLERQSA